MLKGRHHLFLYVLAENTHELEAMLYRIRSAKPLVSVRSAWSASYITYAYGYTPIRQEFLETLKEKVWHRTKEQPRMSGGQLLQREYGILTALNRDGRKSFSEIDAELGIGKGSSDYTYYRLIEKKILYRITIDMKRLPIKYPAIISLQQTDIQGFNAHRNEFRVHLINNPETPTNRYTLFGDIGSPYGAMFIKPIYEGETLDAVVNATKDAMREKLNPNVDIITDILIGTLGARRMPPEQTYQYKILQEQLDKQK